MQSFLHVLYVIYCHLADRLCPRNLEHIYYRFFFLLNVTQVRKCVSSQCNHLNAFTHSVVSAYRCRCWNFSREICILWLVFLYGNESLEVERANRGPRGIWQTEIQFFGAIGIIRHTRGSIQVLDVLPYKISIKILINRASPVARYHTTAKRRADRFSINPNYRISGVTFSVKSKQVFIKYICFIE